MLADHTLRTRTWPVSRCVVPTTAHSSSSGNHGGRGCSQSGHDGAARTHDGRVFERCEHRREPTGPCARVVVEQGDQRRVGPQDAGVAVAGRTRLEPVGEHGDLRPLAADPVEQIVVVIDGDDHVDGCRPLREHRRDRVDELRPPPLRVAGDDDADTTRSEVNHRRAFVTRIATYPHPVRKTPPTIANARTDAGHVDAQTTAYLT